MHSRLAIPAVLLLAACKPPAADDYVARVGIEGREGPSEPLDSPDTTGAIWAPGEVTGQTVERIIYGIPGERPLMALACENTGGLPMLTYTRYTPADPHAKAVLALIGNSHVARFKIDATRMRGVWLWQGSVRAVHPDLEALTGPREVEATVPGAGSVILNPSGRPAELVQNCRALAEPEPEPGEVSPEAPE